MFSKILWAFDNEFVIVCACFIRDGFGGPTLKKRSVLWLDRCYVFGGSVSVCLSPLTQLLLPKSSAKYRALKAQEVTL
jgi:hypothetical protein